MPSHRGNPCGCPSPHAVLSALRYLLLSSLLLLLGWLVFLALSNATPTGITAIKQIAAEWAQLTPWSMRSINFVTGGLPKSQIPLLPALAIWLGLAFLLHGIGQHANQQNIDWRVLLIIFLSGWLLLDLRWQANLIQRHQQSYQHYHAHRQADRVLVADRPLYALIQIVKKKLPADTRRLIILAGWNSQAHNEYYKKRSHYYLLPYNSISSLKKLPGIRFFKPGDCILLLGPASGFSITAREGHLWWGQRANIAVIPLLLTPHGRLYQVK